jgi:hypothetical protein
MYISGSRLRGFIKRHAATLQIAIVYSVYLTDSTWRSIAQGLRKCYNLTNLAMHHLLQKRAAPPLAENLPQKYARNEFGDCRIRVRTEVEELLDVFVRYFSTRLVQHFTDATTGYVTPPTYYGVNFFILPEQKIVRYRAEIEVTRYAAEVLGE